MDTRNQESSYGTSVGGSMQVGDLVKEKRRSIYITKGKYAIVTAVHKPHGFTGLSKRRIEVLYDDGSTAVRSELWLEATCK